MTDRSFRLLQVITVALVINLLSACGDDSDPVNNNGPPPGSEKNRVRLGCPVTVTSPPIGTIVQLDVLITNDRNVSGFTLGFRHNSEDIEIVGISIGPVLEGRAKPSTASYPEENLFLVLWADLTADNPITPRENEKLFSLRFLIPAAVAEQNIDVDSSFVQPSGRFMFALGEGDEVTAGFDDCGAADIIIQVNAGASGRGLTFSSQ